MPLVTLILTFRRYALLVVIGFLGAGVIGGVLAGRLQLTPPKLIDRQTVSGTATGRVLLSQPSAPTASLNLKADRTDSLGSRAALLSDLLASDRLRRMVAASAGIAPDRLAILGPSIDLPQIGVPLALQASEAARSTTEPYVLVARPINGVPIINMSASGPTARAAAKVMDAATRTLQAQVTPRSAGDVGLAVDRLGSPQLKTFVRHPRKIVAAGAALMFLGTWCFAIILMAPIVDRRRGRRGRDGGPGTYLVTQR
jgi:hypothetical protein